MSHSYLKIKIHSQSAPRLIILHSSPPDCFLFLFAIYIVIINVNFLVYYSLLQ